MPQGAAPLKAEKLKALIAWQKSGAIWPVGKPSIDGNLWSLKPVKLPAIPTRVPVGWNSPIDALIAADFTKKGIKPSPIVDRATLIKRASMTVTGLPPTYAQVKAFVQNKSPKAYSDLVDSLLASPAFGERMARQWMDIARYADTKGYVFDRIFLCDEPFFDLVHCDTYSRWASSLSGTALEDVELAVFDCELDVLHVLVVLFEYITGFFKLLVDDWILLCKLGNWHWCTNTSNNILALSIHQVLAKDDIFACGCITCERNTGTTVITTVAKDHCLDVDSGSD